MSDKEQTIRQLINTQERMLKRGILIEGLNLAATREWRLGRIEELQKQLEDAQ